MTRFVPTAALTLALLAIGTAAEAQSYAPLGSTPTQAAQPPQTSPLRAVAPASYTAVPGSSANGAASAPSRKRVHH